MEANLIPSSFKTAISPAQLFINRKSSAILAMLGTLDRCEYEAIGAWFVAKSQDAGQWLQVVEETRYEVNSDGHAMVELGYLSEMQVNDKWHYGLSQFAIEQIFVRQTNQRINQLKAEIRWAHGVRLVDRLKKLFTPAPVFG
jgi:hypothetical protein